MAAPRKKGQHTGASIDYLRAMHKIDARNAGWRSIERGHTGDESRYLRWRVADDAEFQQGRAEALAAGLGS